MVYAHESNLDTKIRDDYEGYGSEIEVFKERIYKEYREKLEELDYASKKIEVFKDATDLIEDYITKIKNFEDAHEKITSQSKFKSTFIEEISTYLFKDLPLISDGPYGIYNQNIFAGMKINNQMKIDILKKNVDFCVGKKVKLKVDDEAPEFIIMPVVCVEVKTYLDATMFGEVQWSSRQIKNASPNVKTYVFMESNGVGKEKIIAARYDNNLNEMIRLRKGSRDFNQPINPEALLQYYEEISSAIENGNVEDTIEPFGRLFDRKKWF